MEVATKAATLLNSAQKRTFLIAALVVMQHTSGIILPVSKLLQKKELDIFAVIELIDSVLDILSDKTEAITQTFFKPRTNVKNMVLHY